MYFRANSRDESLKQGPAGEVDEDITHFFTF
jgi:hypothetical protein